mmetsp:Transcript_64082/g.196013  ORF Transcript_64082/g.196013 Transcript_64082/m.196013 type:complete len:381 (+) Transcript_64082:406-1548(+)
MTSCRHVTLYGSGSWSFLGRWITGTSTALEPCCRWAAGAGTRNSFSPASGKRPRLCNVRQWISQTLGASGRTAAIASARPRRVAEPKWYELANLWARTAICANLNSWSHICRSSSYAILHGRLSGLRTSAMERKTFPAVSRRCSRTCRPCLGGSSYSRWMPRWNRLSSDSGSPSRTGLTSSDKVSIKRKVAVTIGSDPGYFNTLAAGSSCATPSASILNAEDFGAVARLLATARGSSMLWTVAFFCLLQHVQHDLQHALKRSLSVRGGLSESLRLLSTNFGFKRGYANMNNGNSTNKTDADHAVKMYVKRGQPMSNGALKRTRTMTATTNTASRSEVRSCRVHRPASSMIARSMFGLDACSTPMHIDTNSTILSRNDSRG